MKLPLLSSVMYSLVNGPEDVEVDLTFCWFKLPANCSTHVTFSKRKKVIIITDN
jgi:hypothetical protein